jgi:hypothetical protein
MPKSILNMSYNNDMSLRKAMDDIHISRKINVHNYLTFTFLVIYYIKCFGYLLNKLNFIFVFLTKTFRRRLFI